MLHFPRISLNGLKDLYAQIKARKVRKQIAVYASAGLTILGVTNLFSGVYHLPPVVFDVVLTALVCGLPCAVVSAWVHGVEGAQKVRWPEVATYGVCLLVALFLGLRLVYHPGARILPSEARSIVVLPFENLSDNKDDLYFSDGMTDDIITQLSTIGGLRVISRSSAMRYRDAKKSSREIGNELDVTHLLEGSIRREGERVRIVGRLVDVRDDRQVWAETYDRQLSDVFVIQADVARNIARALQAALSPEEERRIDAAPTQNLDAYACYLRGREFYYRYSPEDNERAIEFFRKALTFDSLYALAYAGLGDAYGLRATRYGAGGEWADSAIRMSRHAIELDPSRAEGYKALGLSLEKKGQIRAALDSYYKAVALNPGYAPVVASIGAANYSLGLYDEALPWVRKAVTLQPDLGHYYTLVGLQYFSLGFDSAAAHWIGRGEALQPGMVFPNILRSFIDLYGGRTEQGLHRLDSLLLLRPREVGVLDAAGDLALVSGQMQRAARYYSAACALTGQASPSGAKLAWAVRALGDRTRADAMTAEIIKTFADPEERYPEGSLIPYVVAQTFSSRNDTVRAAQWMHNALLAGYADYRWVSIDPLLGALRSSRAGASLMETLRARYDAMRNTVETSERAAQPK